MNENTSVESTIVAPPSAPWKLSTFCRATALTLTAGLVVGAGAAGAQAAVLETSSAATIARIAGTQLASVSPATADQDSAAQTPTVDVPVSSASDVVLTQGGHRIEVSMPGAAHDAKASRADEGVVVYDGAGTKDAVVPTADGVQFLTLIENEDAPTEFSYGVDVPTGGSILIGEARGMAVVVDSDGSPIAVVKAPWAKDARGKSVPTYFSTDGSTLTQHVDHSEGSVHYPVVADPHFAWYWSGVVVTLSHDEMGAVAAGGPTVMTGLIGVPGIGWGAIAGVAWVAGSAAWAYHNHKCFWFWFPFPLAGIDDPDVGYYDC
jgi:hypothetical protein